MTCFYPMVCFQAALPDDRGMRPVSFKRPRQGADMRQITLPCGRCSGCRLEKAQAWAVRMTHEAQMHDFNEFLTLTYRPGEEPPGFSLSKRHCQLFLKRLRKWQAESGQPSCRYYLAGEYGDDRHRPHYHAIVFGVRFPDERNDGKTKSGHQLRASELLESIWSHGRCWIGDVSFDSACYVSSYVMKKITGEKAADHYHGREPEFALMSRRPGIGGGWLDRYPTDVYPSDGCVVGGRVVRPPRYYDDRFSKISPDDFVLVKELREAQTPADQNRRAFESSRERLAVKEEVAASKMATYKQRS